MSKADNDCIAMSLRWFKSYTVVPTLNLLVTECRQNSVSNINTDTEGCIYSCIEPILDVIGQEAGYTLDGSAVHHRATQRQMRHTLNKNINATFLFLLPFLMSWNAFGLPSRLMVEKWTFTSRAAALVDIPAVSMPIARSLKTCDICGIVLCDKTAHVGMAFYCGQPTAHLCNHHAVLSASWSAKPVRWDGLSRQRRSAH